ncbi:hypothetical protein KFK09_025347 [Dendrobium nobile]|uniref:Uncharacterized protein n=1 Tax=Dendrobium nobile TaxID=94219 RepID=A0A8T3AFW7_DENNO|nr:hypothetical protein KFK09_025347 [Dendrobium nobile]
MVKEARFMQHLTRIKPAQSGAFPSPPRPSRSPIFWRKSSKNFTAGIKSQFKEALFSIDLCSNVCALMEDFSVPSFSLGLDIDLADLPTEGEEEEEEAGHPGLQSCPNQRQEEEESVRKSSIQEWEEIGGQETLGEAQEEEPPPRVLKRLRRGPPSSSPAAACISRPSAAGGDLTHESPPLYDDIEEFSSPDKDPKRCSDDYPSTQSHITCSNAKFSLLHRGFLKDNSECKHRASKVPASGCFSTLTSLDARNDKVTFPRLTISPIRKINLIDSDSDDSSNSKDKCRKNEVTGVSLKKGKHFHEACAAWEAKKSFLASKCQKESFLKDISSNKNSKLETPALDEFCKEYFRSIGDQNVNHIKGEFKSSCFGSSSGFDTHDLIDGSDVLNSPNNINGEVDRNWDLSSPQPPAYQYFYHTDPRIQTLVRQRLPHFVLLGTKNNTDAQQFGAESLDYIRQFSPTLAGGKAHIATEKLSRSNSSKKQNKKSCSVIEASDAAGSWVNPRFKATVPKDAGKRRVSADVRQSGHWFTEQDGRKVYVSKDGEKSTGRTAYAKYKKETGGFRKAKRKTAAKKSKKVRR